MVNMIAMMMMIHGAECASWIVRCSGQWERRKPSIHCLQLYFASCIALFFTILKSTVLRLLHCTIPVLESAAFQLYFALHCTVPVLESTALQLYCTAFILHLYAPYIELYFNALGCNCTSPVALQCKCAALVHCNCTSHQHCINTAWNAFWKLFPKHQWWTELLEPVNADLKICLWAMLTILPASSVSPIGDINRNIPEYDSRGGLDAYLLLSGWL